MTAYAVIGLNYYAKDEYTPSDAFYSWLMLAGFPTSGKAHMLAFDCDYDDLTFSVYGVEYPTGSKIADEEIDLKHLEHQIKTLLKYQEDFESAQYDLYTMLPDIE